jgi:hypothetical protein
MIGRFLLLLLAIFMAASPSLAQQDPFRDMDRPAGGALEKDLVNDTGTAPPLIPPDVRPSHAAGWVRQTASLLFFDEAGNLSNEIGLRTDEESSGTRINVHEIRGAASKNGRFAWVLDRTTTWNMSRSKILESRRLLRFYGSTGKELWSSSEADVPENGEPILFSANGETVLVSLRNDRGWTAAVKSYLGSTLIDVGPMPRLQLMTLTENGQYAMVRWLVPDQSATHTFLEIPTKTRHDLPSADLFMGLARITEDGKVYSGKRFVFDFTAIPKKNVPAGLPPIPAVAPSARPETAPPSGPDRP